MQIFDSRDFSNGIQLIEVLWIDFCVRALLDIPFRLPVVYIPRLIIITRMLWGGCLRCGAAK